VSRPELIAGVEVSRINPDLGRLATADVEDLDNAVFQPPTGPIGARGEQRDRVLVVGDDVVQLSAECSPRQLKGPAEEPEYLGYAVVVTGQRTPARIVQADALGEIPVPQCVDVASPGSRKRPRTRSSFGCAI
jgi:hypothetical protein